jgi:predicted N-acetyltransferase YhbS
MSGAPAALVIRSADVRDVDSLHRLINSAFVIEQFFAPGPRISRDAINAQISTGVFLIADLEGEPAGCVFVNTTVPTGYMGLLSVSLNRQGAGVGGRLVAAAEAACRAAGCSSIAIRVVNLREELPPFYRARGYREDGTAPFDGEGAVLPCHFILMSKPL